MFNWLWKLLGLKYYDQPVHMDIANEEQPLYELHSEPWLKDLFEKEENERAVATSAVSEGKSEYIPMTEAQIEEHRVRYNEAVNMCNELSEFTLDSMIKEGKCPYPSQHMFGPHLGSIGMHHCPLCGNMVCAGFPHT